MDAQVQSAAKPYGQATALALDGSVSGESCFDECDKDAHGEGSDCIERGRESRSIDMASDEVRNTTDQQRGCIGCGFLRADVGEQQHRQTESMIRVRLRTTANSPSTSLRSIPEIARPVRPSHSAR